MKKVEIWETSESGVSTVTYTYVCESIEEENEQDRGMIAVEKKRIAELKAEIKAIESDPNRYKSAKTRMLNDRKWRIERLEYSIRFLNKCIEGRTNNL